MTPILLDGKQVEQVLNISRKTLWRWRKHKKFPVIYIGKKPYYQGEDIKKGIKEKGN